MLAVVVKSSLLVMPSLRSSVMERLKGLDEPLRKLCRLKWLSKAKMLLLSSKQ